MPAAALNGPQYPAWAASVALNQRYLYRTHEAHLHALSHGMFDHQPLLPSLALEREWERWRKCFAPMPHTPRHKLAAAEDDAFIAAITSGTRPPHLRHSQWWGDECKIANAVNHVSLATQEAATADQRAAAMARAREGAVGRGERLGTIGVDHERDSLTVTDRWYKGALRACCCPTHPCDSPADCGFYPSALPRRSRARAWRDPDAVPGTQHAPRASASIRGCRTAARSVSGDAHAPQGRGTAPPLRALFGAARCCSAGGA